MMFLILTIALFVSARPDQVTETEVIRVLIVTGYDHPAHDWRMTTPALREVLEKDDRFEVRVVEDPEFLTSTALNNYDVVLLHFMNWKRPDPSEAVGTTLQKYVDNGGGLVVVHFACGAFGEWPEYHNLAGRVWDKKNSHDPRGPFQVKITAPDHRITHEMKSFQTDDELYTCLTGDRSVETLAVARSKVDDKDHPMAFCFEYGQGRVFHTPLGHDARAIRNAGTAELIRRGCAWAAGHQPVVKRRETDKKVDKS